MPLDIMTQTIAILAKRRAGKSYTMRRIAEQILAAGQQVVLVDPKGDQWGIRSSADGKHAGFPITILGGEHGDVPLEVGAGELVAKLVVEERVSILIDLSFFRKHEVATFMTAFMENLYRLKAREEYRTPVALIIDEADAIAPQKPQRGEERMLGAADDIVRRGGQRGLGCILVSQRSAVLNKNVLTQAQMLIVLRTIAPQDLSAMKAWIEVHGTIEEGKEMMSSLPSLPIGDAYLWSPGWPTAEGIFKRVHVSPIKTFDSGATPKPGEKKIVPKDLAKVDLEALKKQMAATIEKAAAEDPKTLKKIIGEKNVEIQRLQRASGPTPDMQKHSNDTLKMIDQVAAEVSKAIKKRDVEWKPQLDAANKEIDRISGILGKIAKLAGEETHAVFMTPDFTLSQNILKDIQPGDVARFPNTGSILRISQEPSSEGISGPEQRVLDGIAWMNSIGVPEPSRVAVAFLADYSSRSSGYVKACGALRTKGLVDYLPGDLIILTNEGRYAAQFPDKNLSNVELHEAIYRRLSPREREVLLPIIEASGREISKNEVASLANYSENSSGYVKILGKLRTLGLIDYAPGGMVKAEKILFPV